MNQGKLDVFGKKFRSNTFTFGDQLFLIFWDGESTLKYIQI
jgi:N6-adenosine-specific RNA methylase IME4